MDARSTTRAHLDGTTAPSRAYVRPARAAVLGLGLAATLTFSTPALAVGAAGRAAQAAVPRVATQVSGRAAGNQGFSPVGGSGMYNGGTATASPYGNGSMYNGGSSVVNTTTSAPASGAAGGTFGGAAGAARSGASVGGAFGGAVGAPGGVAGVALPGQTTYHLYNPGMNSRFDTTSEMIKNVFGWFGWNVESITAPGGTTATQQGGGAGGNLGQRADRGTAFGQQVQPGQQGTAPGTGANQGQQNQQVQPGQQGGNPGTGQPSGNSGTGQPGNQGQQPGQQGTAPGQQQGGEQGGDTTDAPSSHTDDTPGSPADADSDAGSQGSSDADSAADAGSDAADQGSSDAGSDSAAGSDAIPAAAGTIAFSNSGISVGEGVEGVKASGTTLTIQQAGSYLVTGSCSEGSIEVKKGVTGVTLTLRDLTLSSSTTAPVTIKKTAEATINVEGTVTLTDAEDPANETSADEAVADAFEGAAIKAKAGSRVTITGTGTLTIEAASCKNGIKGASTTALVIDGGTINVKAANNGIASDGSVVVNGGTIKVTAGNDGIKSEPDEDDSESAGTVTINGGSITIDAVGDAVQATHDVTVTGGSLNAVTFGGYSKARSLGDESAKGLKSDTAVAVSGGELSLNCADDAVHSNGSVTLAAGTLAIWSGDDAVHADGTLTVGAAGTAGPRVDVKASYEGLEGVTVNMASGDVDIVASDDGVNAANKTLGESNAAFAINVTGGELRVDAGGDGLDSNGTISNAGGTVVAYGSADNGNAAVDYGDRGGAWEVGGGTVLAVGMGGMAVAPTRGTYVAFGSVGMGGGVGGFAMQDDGTALSTIADAEAASAEEGLEGQAGPGGFGGNRGGGPQSQMPGNPGQQGGTQGAASSVSIAKGNTLAIKNASGATLFEATATKSANSVVFAAPALSSGQSYTLYVNGSAVATSSATSR